VVTTARDLLAALVEAVHLTDQGPLHSRWVFTTDPAPIVEQARAFLAAPEPSDTRCIYRCQLDFDHSGAHLFAAAYAAEKGET